MGEAKRRREAAIRALQEASGVDRELAEHMYDRQLVTQFAAEEMRRQGHDGEVVFVDTSATEGFEVTCVGGCGRRARLPFEPPPGKAVSCPDCVRGLSSGGDS